MTEGREAAQRELGVRLYAAGRVSEQDANTFLVEDGENSHEVWRSDFSGQFATCEDCGFSSDCRHAYAAELFFFSRYNPHTNPVPEEYRYILDEVREAQAGDSPAENLMREPAAHQVQQLRFL